MDITSENTKIQQAFSSIENHRHRLSGNGNYFIDSLRKFYRKNKKLTERQQKALFEIRDNLC